MLFTSAIALMKISTLGECYGNLIILASNEKDHLSFEIQLQLFSVTVPGHLRSELLLT